MSKQSVKFMTVVIVVLCAWHARAQMLPNLYGPPVSVENAKKAAAGALAEARKNNWNMAVAVVDPSGNLVYYEKMDNTQLGSAHVSIDKARSSALFKRPTKAMEDAVAGGRVVVMTLANSVPVEGGVPLSTGEYIRPGMGMVPPEILASQTDLLVSRTMRSGRLPLWAGRRKKTPSLAN